MSGAQRHRVRIDAVPGGYVAEGGQFIERCPGNQWNRWASLAAYEAGEPAGLIETHTRLGDACRAIRAEIRSLAG